MTITWAWIAGVGGGIVLLWQVAKVILEIVSPAVNLKETVDRHEDDIKEIKKTMEEIKDSLDKGNHMNTMQLVCMTNMMDHMIYGNHTENMLATKKGIQDLLSNNTEK